MSNMDIAERRIPQDGRITMKVDNKVIDVRVARHCRQRTVKS